MNIIYKKIEEYNPKMKLRVLIVFYDMILGMFSNTPKLLDYIQHTILSWKFQTKKNFNKLRLIIRQILTFRILWIFIKNVSKNYIFWLIDIALVSDNSSHFIKIFLQNIQNIVRQYEKVKDDSNTEAAEVSALSSGKIDKDDYLTGEEILPSDQSRIRKQAKFTYSYSVRHFKNK